MSSDESQFRPGECAETSGFLFAHACGDFADFECTQCGKPICHRHTSQELGGPALCTACARQAYGEQSAQGGPSDRYSNDPYFYSHRYYPTYMWHGHDFTEGDEAVLTGGEADANDLRGFENDMGAS